MIVAPSFENQISASSYPALLEVSTPMGIMSIRRPAPEEVVKTKAVAKPIFTEAFATTYTEYHRQSGSGEPIEKWLRLQPMLTFHGWLSNAFDEEYAECLSGKKIFLHIWSPSGQLIGLAAHTPLSEKGEVYFSELAFEAGTRNHKVATAILAEALKVKTFKQLFPTGKEVKLITRKINVIAQTLYLRAGFKKDDTIDPSVYGESYDDRYIGFRLTLDE